MLYPHHAHAQWIDKTADLPEQIALGLAIDASIPSLPALYQNYPNPLNLAHFSITPALPAVSGAIGAAIFASRFKRKK